MFLYDAKTELSFVRIAMTGALLSGRSDMGGQIFISSFSNFIPPFFLSRPLFEWKWARPLLTLPCNVRGNFLFAISVFCPMVESIQ